MAELAAVIASGIADWFAQRPSLNLHSLHMKTGVPYATLKRAANAEGIPSEKTVIALAPFLFKGEDLDEVWRLIGFSHAAPTQKKSDRGSIPTFLDTTSVYIWGMLNRPNGVTEEEIQLRFGTFGVERLKDWTASEFAQLSSGVYRALESNSYSIERSEIFERISMFMDLMKKDNAENQALFQSVFSVSPKGFSLAVNEWRNSRNNLLKIFKDHPGDIVGLMGTVFAKISGEDQK